MPDGSQSTEPAQLQTEMQEMQAQLAELQAQAAQPSGQEDRVSVVVFSGELDKLIAAYVIATGAAAMGSEVTLFFTFWGTAALREKSKAPPKKFLERLIGWVLPSGTGELKTSTLQFAGGGPKLMRHLMKKNGVASLEEMMEMSADLGVQTNICTMSMDLLGFEREEFDHIPNVIYCGVAKFLEAAGRGRVTLFV